MKNDFTQETLLKTVSKISSQLAEGININEVLNNLLTDLLSLSNSTYGFIGEIQYSNNTYLKMHAIVGLKIDNTNITNKHDKPTVLNSFFCDSLQDDSAIIKNESLGDDYLITGLIYLLF